MEENKKKKSYIVIILFILVVVLLLIVFFKKTNIENNNISLKYGENYKIKLNKKYEDNDLEWTSSNPDLVVVENGNIYFKSNESGNVTITVKSKDGYEENFEITVVKSEDIINVESIDITKYENLEISKDKDIKICADVYPENATNKAVVYESSVPNSVSIDNDGNVKVLNDNVDSVVITATSVDGNYISKINLRIKKESNVESDSSQNQTHDDISFTSLSFDKKEITLNTGDYFSLQSILNLKPIDGNRSNLVWSYGITDKNAPVIEVDKTNGVVRAIRGGTSTVTVKFSNLSASVRVNVKNHNKITGNFLKTDKTKIVKNVNGTNMPVVLKGINLGAWLSRSYSMSAFVPLAKADIESNKYGADSCINNNSFYGALLSKSRDGGNLTETQVKELSGILYDNFITEEDFDLISQMGANVVRLPIEYSFFSKYSTVKDALDYIENVVRIAGERGIYTIIDLHLAKGRQNSGGYCGGAEFYTNQAYIKEMINLWGHIAFRFKDNVMVAGYELLNEPEGNTKTLISYYNSAYKIIRKYDKNHIVIMDENCVVCGYEGASSVRENDDIGSLPNPSVIDTSIGKDVKWYNVVYSTHDYTYKTSDQSEKTSNKNIEDLIVRLKEKLENVKKKSDDYNVPYYVGEFSFYGTINDRNNKSSDYKKYLQAWNVGMDLYEKYGFSYSPWTYKANNDLYYGLVFWGTKANKDYGTNCVESNSNYNCIKANLLKDSYNVLKTKFSYKSYENMKFNEDFYFMFLEQFNSKRIVTSIKADVKKLEMNVGDIKFVNATVSPNTAINKKLNWKSSNSNVATVDSNTGMIKAIGKGKATITITNNPFTKYIDSADIYKCDGKLASNIKDASLNDYSCKKTDLNNSNDKSISTTIEIVVN